MIKYDSVIIGPVCNDINIDYTGDIVEEYGGAVLYSGFSAERSGYKIAAVSKSNINELDPKDAFKDAKDIDVFHVESPTTTFFKNEYFTKTREERKSSVPSVIEGFKLEEIPELNGEIYHLAGLVNGDFQESMITAFAKKGKVALDTQSILRYAVNGKIEMGDWPNKTEYLNKITYLKTDALEAKILTGIEDRREAAKKLSSWGTKEILITHHSEVLVYDGSKFYTVPFKARSLEGRTGRGDTCFSAYVNERQSKSIEDSLLYAAGITSLKMETPGPFKGSRQDVESFIKEFY